MLSGSCACCLDHVHDVWNMCMLFGLCACCLDLMHGDGLLHAACLLSLACIAPGSGVVVEEQEEEPPILRTWHLLPTSTTVAMW